MKKIIVFFALFCAMVLMIGCDNSDSFDSETSDNGGNGGNGSSGSSDAGIHLGIIGFNNHLEKINITLLTDYNAPDFIRFIRGLERENNTALYYAVDNALDMMKEYKQPAKLQHVALVTFTDGIDNHSTSANLRPDYDKSDDYLEDVHNKIKNNIHGLPVESYVIGLRTKDEISDALLPKFEKILKNLASSDSNAFQVDNMNEVQNRFAEIANNLVKVSTSVNYGVYMPGGYDPGQIIRYTFDNARSAESSELYIEATYNKKTVSLEKIIYHGFAKGATTLQGQVEPDGTLYYQFNDLKYSDGTTASDKMSFALWQQVEGEWKSETEITPENYPPKVKKDISSALIMLVLDCTTSLSSDNFNIMKDAANEFINTLADPGSNIGNNGNSDHGDSGNSGYSGDTGSGDTGSGDTIGDGCETENQGRVCATDTECGNCMICTTGGKCSKGCITDADCTMQTGLHCNTKLARCLSIYASNKACSEVNCPTGCCYAEKGLTGLRCASQASPATCGLCAQGEIWSPSDSKCISAVCSATTDNCPSLNIGATNPSAACYKCKSGELICQANTTQSGCSASGVIINAAQCIPSGQQCVEGVSECCSGMPCIDGYCY